MKINLVSLKNNFTGKFIIEPEIAKKCDIGKNFITNWGNILPENSSIEVTEDGSMNLKDSICHIYSYVDGKPVHGLLHDDWMELGIINSINRKKLTFHLHNHLRDINKFIQDKFNKTEQVNRDKRIAACIKDNMNQGVY